MKYNILIPNNLPLDNTDETAIVIASCSRYKEAWEPFFILFKKYWPDCPYKIYFLTDVEYGNLNNISLSSYFTFLSTEKDNGWIKNIRQLIPKIKEKKIILFQEDFLLTKMVKTIKIRQLTQFALQNNVGCLRLTSCPSPSSDLEDIDFLGRININDDYRFSMQLSIWDKNLFLRILDKANTLQDLEKFGSQYTKNEPQDFLGLWRESEEEVGGPIQYIITAIIRGFWDKVGIQHLIKENISIENLTIGKKI